MHYHRVQCPQSVYFVDISFGSSPSRSLLWQELAAEVPNQLGDSKVAEFRKALPEFRKVSNLRCVLAPFWAVFYIFEKKSKNIHFDFQFFFRVDNHTQY